jgi:phosphoglycerate dehydrogenase-like enzyme
MDAALKIVTRLPLQELWRDDGFKTTARLKSLTEEDIRSLLRSGTIQFVVVDVGTPPRWIQPSECFQFWKIEAQPHLALITSILDEFPDQYCYFASQWDGGDRAAPIVALEKQH